MTLYLVQEYSYWPY